LKKKDKIMAANNTMANMLASPEILHRYRVLFRLIGISERFVLFKKYRAIEHLKLASHLWKMNQLYAHQIHSRGGIEVQSESIEDISLNDTLDHTTKDISPIISTICQDDRITDQQPEHHVSSPPISDLPSEYEENKQRHFSMDMIDTNSEKERRTIMDLTNQYHSDSEEEDQDVNNYLDEAIEISKLEDLLKTDVYDGMSPKYMKDNLVSSRLHESEEIQVFRSTELQSPISDKGLSLEYLASVKTFKQSAIQSDPPSKTKKQNLSLDDNFFPDCREGGTHQTEPQEEVYGKKLPLVETPTSCGNQDDAMPLLDIMTDSTQFGKTVKTRLVKKISNDLDEMGSATVNMLSTQTELIGCNFSHKQIIHEPVRMSIHVDPVYFEAQLAHKDAQELANAGKLVEVIHTGIQVEDLFQLAHIGVQVDEEPVLTQDTGTQPDRVVFLEAEDQVVNLFQLAHEEVQIQQNPVHTEEIGTQAEEVKIACVEAGVQVMDLFHLADKDIQVGKELAQTESMGTQIDELKKPVCLEADVQVIGLYELAHKDTQVEEESILTEEIGTQAQEVKPACMEVGAQVIDLFEFVHTDTQVYVPTEEMGTQVEEFKPLCLETGSQVVGLVELFNKDIQVEEELVKTEEIGVQIADQSPVTAETEVQVQSFSQLAEIGCQAVEIKLVEERGLQVEEPKALRSDVELQVEIRNSQEDLGIQTDFTSLSMHDFCLQTEEVKKMTADADNQTEKDICSPSIDSSVEVELLIVPTVHAQIQVEEIKQYTNAKIQASFEQSVKEIQTQNISVDTVAAQTGSIFEFRTQEIQSDLTMEKVKELEKLALCCHTIVQNEGERTEVITKSGPLNDINSDILDALDFKEQLGIILKGFVKKQELAVNVFTSLAAIEHTKWAMALHITVATTNQDTCHEENAALLHINKRLYKTFSQIVTIFTALEKKVEALELLVANSPIKPSDIQEYDLGFFQELIVGYSTTIHSFFDCAKSNTHTEAYIWEITKQFSILQEVTTKEVSRLMSPTKSIPQDWKNVISVILLDLMKTSEKLKCELEYELEGMEHRGHNDNCCGYASQSHSLEQQALPRRVVERKVPLSPSQRSQSHLDKINLWFEQAICTSPSKRKLLNLPEDEKIDENVASVTEDEFMSMLKLENGACIGCIPTEKTIKVKKINFLLIA
jgi:hypothetical protein